MKNEGKLKTMAIARKGGLGGKEGQKAPAANQEAAAGTLQNLPLVAS
jgi:hypothetical protein